MSNYLTSGCAVALALSLLAACGQSDQDTTDSAAASEASDSLETPADSMAEDAAEPTAPPPLSLPPQEDMARALQGFSVPGAAMARIEDCQVAEVEGYGTANLETGAPVTPNTLFEAASLTKPVFAWLVMTLVDEGTIDLDKPIADEMDFPRLADQDAYAQITPRLVLTHRTGMPNWVGDSQDFERTDPIELIAQPGEAFTYSGEGFQLLQAYVEQKTGMSLQALFEERLGATMPNSTLVYPLPAGLPTSMGYQSADDPASGRPLVDMDEPQSAGGLITTAGDFGRFVAMVCRGEGLSEEAQAEMLRPQSAMEGGNAEGEYGLGWAILTVNGETIVGHDGNNDEYRTAAFYSPQYREGLVFLSNGANGEDMFNMMMGQ